MMTDLPLDFKDFLLNRYDFTIPQIVKKVVSRDNSVKLLLQYSDNQKTECVIMPENKKNTLCLSSQIGCSRGCLICATGRMGLVRQLLAHEIVSQLILAQQQISPANITNLVFMGMGEPLDNLEEVRKAIAIIQSDYSFQFSPRRMTLSTCGIIPKLYELADSQLKIKLAVSLNSAIDAKRTTLMPINNTYPLSELKKALIYFRQKSPWRITFEYVMIPDFNIGNEDVRALIKYIGDISCKLNLITWNPIEGLPWRSPTPSEALAFQEKLRKLPHAVIIRKSRGADVHAACGQLALQS